MFPMPFSEVRVLIEALAPMLRRGRYPVSYKLRGSQRPLINHPESLAAMKGGK